MLSQHQKFKHQDRRQRFGELAFQRQPLPAQNFPSRQRRGKQQLQRADAPVFGQPLAGLGDDPELQERLKQEDRRHERFSIEHQVVVFEPAPEPHARYGAQVEPDIRRFPAFAADQPEKRIDVEERGPMRPSRFGPAVSPLLEARAVFLQQGIRIARLPDARQDAARQQ